MHITKIFGAPGAGKTTALLNIMYKEIQNGVEPERIAYVTFSRSARQEALDRAIKAGHGLSEQKLPYLRTIHSICYSEVGVQSSIIMGLEDYMGFAKYCPVEFSDNFTLTEDVDRLPFGYNNSPGNRILNIRQTCSAREIGVFSPGSLVEGWTTSIEPQHAAFVLRRYNQYRLEKGKLDYVDLLHLYRDHGEPIDVDVAIIDEAQDLSSLQWRLVWKMFAKCSRLYMAGDDDQAIFQFLGASPYGFLDAPCDEKIILSHSHRLPEKIASYASSIISRNVKREPKVIEADKPGGIVQYHACSAEEVLNTRMADDLRDVMVIGATNYQLNDLSYRLQSRGIPVRYKGSLTEGNEAKRFYWYHKFRRGESMPITEAVSLLRLLDIDGWKDWRDRARLDPAEMVEPEALREAGVIDIEGREVCAYLAGKKKKERIYGDLYTMAAKFGLESVIAPPQVTLTTYHGAKGREAAKVILMTDCSYSAQKYAADHMEYERRLAYVGATRAKEELHICAPQYNLKTKSFHYMRALQPGEK